MRVLVTGASGYVGSHATAALLGAGHEVVAFARNPSRFAAALEAFGLDASRDPRVSVTIGDLGDPGSIRAAAEGVDAIVHAAAEVGVSGSTGPADDRNVIGTAAVLDAARIHGVDRIVYTSSLAVFLPSPDEVIGVDSPLAEPLSAYGRSKRDAELVVRAAQDDGLGVVTLYPGGVYGPISPNLDNSFAAIIGAITFGMLCPPGGMGIIDVRDLAAIVVAALEADRGPRRYLCGGRFLTWPRWTETLAVAAGVDVPIFEVSAEQMVAMGRDADRQREAGGAAVPLSEEAAIIMCSGRPTDDSALVSELGVTFRPVLETMSDAVAYLRSIGALPKLAT